MMRRDIIVIGAPVGGGASLIRLAEALPGELRASVFIVLHTIPENPILLADVLSRLGGMRVTEAADGEPLEQNRIYVAADEKHMVLERDWRPSIDVLFQSAATAHRHRVVGVILLQAREDGVLGLHAIRQSGGRTVTHRNEQMAEKPRHPETSEELAHDHLEIQKIAPRLVAYVDCQNEMTSAWYHRKREWSAHSTRHPYPMLYVTHV